MTLEAQLTDESGKFNLNSLLDYKGDADPDSMDLFRALLGQLQLEPKWAELVADWIDTDGNPQPTGGGAEDNVYTLQKPGYRTANRYITSISELMSLPEFGAERYAKLAPHVSALPPAERSINVCFATPALLDALESHYAQTSQQTYTQMPAEQFAQLRSPGCFPLASTIAGQAKGSTTLSTLAKERIGETSRYFRLHTWVTIGTTRFALYSLLNRDASSGQVQVLYRTFGTE
jgi:general secretion pathway protein K